MWSCSMDSYRSIEHVSFFVVTELSLLSMVCANRFAQTRASQVRQPGGTEQLQHLGIFPDYILVIFGLVTKQHGAA